MNETPTYYTTQEWEAAKTSRTTFEKIYYSRTGEVRKVEGFVTTLKLCRENGAKEYKTFVNKATWDSQGRCTRGKGTRMRRWDITLEKL